MYVAIALSGNEFGEAKNESLVDGQIRMLFLEIQFCDVPDNVRM